MSSLSPNIADYLRTMISPEGRTLTTTEGGECVYLHVSDPDTFSWEGLGDASVHGLTVEATSLAGQEMWVPEAYRVLKPGAHLMLVAPDEEPTGYTGACMAEDAGFEVRDAILCVHGEGAGNKLHYVAKAAKKEREAGLVHSSGQAVAASEGAPGAGAAAEGEDDIDLNRTSKRKNIHPTVKPIKVMIRLLEGVPRDQGPVLDPFMGSGTTLIACLETGHDGIGIEREKDYLLIATDRLQHWNIA